MNWPAWNHGYVRHGGESYPISKVERVGLLGGYLSDLDFVPFVGAGHHDRLDVANTEILDFFRERITQVGPYFT